MTSGEERVGEEPSHSQLYKPGEQKALSGRVLLTARHAGQQSARTTCTRPLRSRTATLRVSD